MIHLIYIKVIHIAINTFSLKFNIKNKNLEILDLIKSLLSVFKNLKRKSKRYSNYSLNP